MVSAKINWLPRSFLSHIKYWRVYCLGVRCVDYAIERAGGKYFDRYLIFYCKTERLYLSWVHTNKNLRRGASNFRIGENGCCREILIHININGV